MNCIATLVDERYECFVPLFLYCANKAYPEWVTWAVTRSDDQFKKNGYTTAVLRFLLGEDVLSNYDNVLITDADILIRREDPDLVQQHRNHMNANGLECYDNCDHGDHMSGVHFVTKDWWERTRPARGKWLEYFKHNEAHQAQDEKIIKDIVVQSNLPICGGHNLWDHHGLHLGRFRDRGINAVRFQPDEFEFLDGLMQDMEFMALIKDAIKTSDLFADLWRCVMAVYGKRKNR